MIKAFRFLAICTIGAAFATSSIASAQTYTTIDFPGAIDTSLNGGPNPEGTSVGSYLDTPGGFLHGFTLTKNGVFTSFDPPGSTSTTPNWISPQGVIVGGYFDASNVSHGFILDGGQYTIYNAPGAAGTVLTSLNPSGEMTGFSCVVASCSTITHSFVVSKTGVFTSFDPPGAISSSASTVNPSGAVVGAYTDSGGVVHGYCCTKGRTPPLIFRALRLRLLERITPRATALGNTTILMASDTLFC
jgi:hypothetical protein